MTPAHSRHLAALLDALRDYLRLYVVMSAAQADAIALWIAHTHVLDAFETTPFLAVTSPEKRCGKSRLLDVIELVVARPWRTIMPSEAVLFRKIDKVAPTLLLDETDAIFNAKNGNTEPLRAVLNAGNRRGTVVPRCVGPRMELIDFKVFGAKALTGIGGLPDTIADRSIGIRLARKRPDETATRFRIREAQELAEPIHQTLASWAQDALQDLEDARPDVPRVLDDRAEEAWEPLLAIAELAGGDWPLQARTAATQLADAGREDDAYGVLLLRDVRDVFADSGADRLASMPLASSLCQIETSPWGDLWGKQLDARGLARRLKPFGISPRTVRFDDETTAKGYLLEQFTDAFARYLGDFERHTDTTRMDTGIAAVSEPSQVTDEKLRKPASVNGCDGVTDKTAREGDTPLPRPLIGDEMYPVLLADAVRDGHLTDAEAEQQYALHNAIVAARSDEVGDL